MKTKQIDIFAFIEDGNLGDPIIGETSRYLIENVCEKNNIKANVRLHSLFPPNASIDFPFINRLRRKCGRPKSNIKRIYIYLLFRLYYILNYKFRRYYNDVLKNSDLVVFGGGGMLKYYSQAFWASDWCILNYCHKNNLPVYFNAIGIEGYDDNNFTSRLIKKMLRKTNIAGITTRDDIDSLNKLLPNNKNKVVGDPALFSKELYGSAEKKDIVGINTIRAGIFNVNGFDTNEDDVIDFYCAMIERLDKDNIKWQKPSHYLGDGGIRDAAPQEEAHAHRRRDQADGQIHDHHNTEVYRLHPHRLCHREQNGGEQGDRRCQIKEHAHYNEHQIH